MTANKPRLGRIQSFTSQSPPLFYHSLQSVKEALNCFLYSDCPAVTTRSVAVIGIFAFVSPVLTQIHWDKNINHLYRGAALFPIFGSSSNLRLPFRCCWGFCFPVIGAGISDKVPETKISTIWPSTLGDQLWPSESRRPYTLVGQAIPSFQICIHLHL